MEIISQTPKNTNTKEKDSIASITCLPDIFSTFDFKLYTMPLTR